MRASLRALLEGLIDYAGLFPPAKLPLAESLANFQRYREGPDSWMLGRFIIPASRLKEIPASMSLPCSALGRGGDTPEAFLASLEADLAEIEASHVPVEVLEAKLPPDPNHFDRLFRQVAERLANRAIAVFLEPPSLERPGLMKLFAALSNQPFGGIKFRAGGLEAAAFPSPDRLAFALCFGVSTKRPVKATAGLHHPLPRFDAGVGARMHGFVNVFLAGILARVRHLSVEQIADLLDDADPASFTFADDGLRWRDFAATTDQIQEARRTAVLSFGSCSFDEPRDDLRALGWL